MSKDWEYAKLSKVVAEAGGPDVWIDMIKKEAYEVGASDMKNKMAIPLLASGIGLGVMATIGYRKIRKRISDLQESRKITEQEARKAEEFLKTELEDAIKDMEYDKKVEEN